MSQPDTEQISRAVHRVDATNREVKMSRSSMRSFLDILRLALAFVLGAAAVAVVVMTYRWPLVWDAQVMHYIRFLMAHGFAPYRDIPDMNMPGIYVLEGWAMHVFGWSDLGWRIYDFTLLAVLCLAMIVIATPYDWVAGLFAGVMFTLVHISNGPWNSVERDEVMTVLIVVGYAFLLEGVRRRKPWLLFAFGLSMGMAATIKPTVAPLGAILLVLVAVKVRRMGEVVIPYLSWGIAGAAVSGGIVVAFLARYHATHSFIELARNATRFYTTLNHASAFFLTRHALPNVEVLILPFVLAVVFVGRQWKGWERWALLLGAAFGAFSYYAQAKGYEYHKYPFTAFALLWMGIELALAMRTVGWLRIVGITGLIAGTLYGTTFYLYQIQHLHTDDNFTMSLQNDLGRMGADRLQHQTQCMDLVEGCYTALYHLQIVQSTGLMGDLLLFAPEKSPIVDLYRQQYWNELVNNPPSVIVLTNEWFNRLPSFAKLDQWPRFADYLETNYQQVIERKFPLEADHAYRLYVRKGTSFRHLPDYH